MTCGFSRAEKILKQGVGAGVAPGFVLGVFDVKAPAHTRIFATGARRLVPGVQPMTEDTVFDLASVSKVYGAATLFAHLVDRGWLRWNTKLKSVLPEFVSDEVELGHLLAHTAGLPAWSPFWESLRKQFGDRIFEAPVADRQLAMRRLVFDVKPEVRPGVRTLYSDISFLLLGFALEEVLGMPLDRAVARYLWEPMGLEKSFYTRTIKSVEEGGLDYCAATEKCPWRGGVLQGQVHDDNCWAMGGYGGHAGVFAPVGDVLRFTAALFGGFLSYDTLKTMWSPVMGGRTYGWDVPSGDEPSVGKVFGLPRYRAVGHLGFTGTSLWVLPKNGLAIALLSNRVHPSRDNILIKSFRSQVHEALAEDLDFKTQ